MQNEMNIYMEHTEMDAKAYFYLVEKNLYALSEQQNDELRKEFPSYFSDGEVLTDMLEWIERYGYNLGECPVLNY